mmetsp:Transcript_20956/g.34633  ORF Transcript_20956/g.34633 Transcript_20956/m.34633 type:complete len:160 (+) Transcript_20956:71-550(+)
MRYKDQHSAPPNTNKSPPDNAKANPAPAPPPHKSTNPHNANKEPTPIDDEMACPVANDTNGVKTTDVCVKKEARALPVLNRPKASNPWAPKFQTASSTAALHMTKEEADDDASSMAVVVSVCSCCFARLENNRGGIKQAVANHPRVAESTEAEGGSGRS